MRPMLLAGHWLDLEAGVLRGADGAPIAMRAQAWAVLRLLARHAGGVVTKQQLLDAVWPDLAVTDGSLAQAVSDIRSAFGAAGHQVVKTVARRGYMLVAPGGQAAALRGGAALPAATAPLFGRDAELALMQGMLAQHRLVTIVGAGGIGKTAFAVAAAQAHVGESMFTAAWVDLASLADPALLPATMARSLGLPIRQHGDALPGLLVALAPLNALALLDNAEHLAANVAALARAMLDAAPGLRLLVTSQVPLHLDDERVFRLSPLDVPAPDASLAQAAGAGAVALFVNRARAADHRFEATADNIGSVIRICRRLDGLPLAIRLAAARLPLLGLAGLESRLAERLQLLAADSRDTPTRQQTLLAALDWSHALLTAQEQSLFRQLGVFVGGFTLPMATSVANAGGAGGADDWAVIDRLGRLVERSLVDAAPGDRPRYRLLESQRDYALQALARHGELGDARRRHAHAMAAALQAGGEAAWSTADAQWLAQWAPELDDVRAALDWSAAHDVALFVSLVGSSPQLFRWLDLGYELRRRADAVDAGAIDTVTAGDPALALRYWLTRSYLQSGVSAGPLHDFAFKAERLARGIGDSRRLYLALCQRAASCLVPAGEQAAMLAEIDALESPDWPPRVRAQRCVAEFALHTFNGHAAAALQAAEQGLALASAAQSPRLTALFGNEVVVALLDQGKLDHAQRRIREIRPCIGSGPAEREIPFIGTSARCALLAGDLDSARALFEEMFAICRSVEWSNFGMFATLYVRLALGEGRTDDAARLLGYATMARRRAWSTSAPSRSLEQARARLAATLGEARLAQLGAEGEGMHPEAVCSLVLATVQRG